MKKMKKTSKKNRYYDCPAYPNAASSRYFVGKLLDAVTAIASSMGVLTVLFFIFLL